MMPAAFAVLAREAFPLSFSAGPCAAPVSSPVKGLEQLAHWRKVRTFEGLSLLHMRVAGSRRDARACA